MIIRPIITIAGLIRAAGAIKESIIRNDEKRNQTFASAMLSKDEIVERAKVNDDVVVGAYTICALPVDSISLLPFERLSQEGQERTVLTRYFRKKDKQGNEIVYAVFEQISEDALSGFSSRQTAEQMDEEK